MLSVLPRLPSNEGGSRGVGSPQVCGACPHWPLVPPEGSVSSLGQALQPELETRTTLAIGRP